MDFQIIVLAAGKGTRMNSEQPKVLADLNGKPLIGHLVDNLFGVGNEQNLIFVIGHKRDEVQGYLGNKYSYAIQEAQLGTGHAVLSAKPLLYADHVVILYGDMPFIKADSIKKLWAEHTQNKSKFSMFTAKVPNFDGSFQAFSNFGRIIRGSDNRITKIQEFKNASDDEKKITEVNPGIYICEANWLWQALDSVSQNRHGEYFLTDLAEIASSSGEKITDIAIDPMEVYGVNTQDQLEVAKGLVK